ncbi:MAG: hypothetical protein AB7P33_08590 [Dehalococcoidia bacterium]
MGFLDKLFGGSKDKSSAAVIEAPPCPHVVLVPRWDTAADIGITDRASRFICEGCEQVFTPEEARQLQATTADRLPQEVEEKSREEMLEAEK